MGGTFGVRGGGANVECSKVFYAHGPGTAATRFPLVGVTLTDTRSPRNHFVFTRGEPEAQQYLAASSIPARPRTFTPRGSMGAS